MDQFYGLHVRPDFESWSDCDNDTLSLRGLVVRFVSRKGGTVSWGDALVAAGYFITQVQSVVGRNVSNQRSGR